MELITVPELARRLYLCLPTAYALTREPGFPAFLFDLKCRPVSISIAQVSMKRGRAIPRSVALAL